MPRTISVRTAGQGLYEVTDTLRELTAAMGAANGVLHLFSQHTSASLVIQENADPDVKRDLVAHFDRLAPENAGYVHTAEGPDDMPAHIKTALTSNALTIPVAGGKLLLGTWQGVYVFEHRKAPHTRNIVATFIAEAASKS